MKRVLVLLPLLLALNACDYLGIEDPTKIEAAKIADAKAIGGACRNARRAIEDCYVLNPKADKAAVLSGWQDMDQYMRDNKLEGIVPTIANVASAPGADGAASGADTSTDQAAKPDKAGKADKAAPSDKKSR